MADGVYHSELGGQDDSWDLAGPELQAGKKSRRWRWIGLTAIVMLAALAAVAKLGSTSAASVMPPTSKVARRPLRATVAATGKLEALKSIDVGAEVSGRILTLTAAENDVVHRGQTLATIASQDLQLAVDQATAELQLNKATVSEAKATLAEAELNLKRTERLRESGLVDQQSAERATANRQRALAGVAAASARVKLSLAALALAHSRLDKATIRSPIDGVVLNRLAEPGQTITAGFQTPQLFRIAEDLTKLRLQVNIAEADIGLVKLGQAASFSVEAFQGREFLSRVTSIANQADTSQGIVSFRAELEVDNAERLLRPGMTCSAKIVTLERRDVLTLPNAALRYRPADKPEPPSVSGQRAVWVLEGGRARQVVVRLGERDASYSEVIEPPLPIGMAVLVPDSPG